MIDLSRDYHLGGVTKDEQYFLKILIESMVGFQSFLINCRILGPILLGMDV